MTARGVGLFSIGVGLIVFAVVMQQRDILWIGAFLALLPITATVLLALGLVRRSAERVVRPDRIPAQQPVEVEVRLHHGPWGLGLFDLVEDRVPPLVGRSPTFVAARRISERSVRLRYALTPTLRGRYRLGPLSWRSGDSLGLASISAGQAAPTPLSVTPPVTGLADLSHGSGVGLDGEAAALRSGLAGPDDALIRDYRPRDDVRRIHWPSTARAGRLMVRREDRAWDPTALVLLDSRRSRHSVGAVSTSFEWAVAAAASVGVHVARGGFRVDLIDAEGQSADVSAVGAQREDALLDFLTDVSLTDSTTLASLVDAAGPHGRAQLVVAVLGQIDASDAHALRSLAGERGRRWALLALDDPASSTEGIDLLRSDGWSVIGDATQVGLVEGWRRLTSGVNR